METELQMTNTPTTPPPELIEEWNQSASVNPIVDSKASYLAGRTDQWRQQQGGWIDVKEKLPEIGKNVPAVLEDGTELMGILYEDGWMVYFSDGRSSILNEHRQVVKWFDLPLPELKNSKTKE